MQCHMTKRPSRHSHCTHSCTITKFCISVLIGWRKMNYYGEVIIYLADEDWFEVNVRKNHKSHVEWASYGKI